MKVGLNVLERSMILSILPREGNFLTMRLLRDLSAKVGISAQEFIDFEIKTIIDEKDPTKSHTEWNLKGAAPTEIELVDPEVDVIRKELKALDEKQKLTIELFSVYEKFVS